MSSASAKVILFGEHAVVYNQPAIAIPVSDLRAFAEVESVGGAFQIIARDLNNRIITFVGDEPLVQVVQLTLEALNVPTPDISMVVRSDIPIASGLGSGASISTAIVRELLKHFDEQLPNDAINEIVYEVEKMHHGTPSGIDNTVIVYERAIYFVRNQPIEPIQIHTPLRLIIADTGKTALTKDSVGDVRRLYENDKDRIVPVLEKIGRITVDARNALETGAVEKLGQLMTVNHKLLQQLTVSSPELDKLVDSAVHAGALGAKLSGGGRGGNMIALVDEATEALISEALLDAGAVRLFKTTLEQTN
ncbi:MAG: mevalonate kinase [Phototrophicaceae bacterium]